jgi:hypothetical protein
MERYRGLPAQEAVRKVTVIGYPSLTNWTLGDCALSRVQHLEEIHWRQHAAIPTSLLRSLQTKHTTCKLYYEIPFLQLGSFDENAPFAQPIGKEHEHEVRAA